MIKRYIILSLYILMTILLMSCYSFTGGSKAEYLKTLQITPVIDNSGYGNPRYREILAQSLVDKFKADNSFELVDRNPDAKLITTIREIKEEKAIVSQQELETERKIVVNIEVEYIDITNKKTIFKQQFSNYELYTISTAQTSRDEAVKKILDKTSDDILFAVISGW